MDRPAAAKAGSKKDVIGMTEFVPFPVSLSRFVLL
jgi:hypothetical protein